MDIYLRSVLGRLEQQYHVMAVALGPPADVTQGSAILPRYLKQSESLLCFLKGVKLVSTLNAALVLLRHGYFHEVAALCRMATDFVNEILFMKEALDGDKLSKDQEQLFAEFFQEEFEDVDDPLGTSKKRSTVARRKIYAAFGQIVSEGLNPSDAKNVATIIHRTLSGYIHGAYPHIMELYDGEPPHFHMDGMPGTSREEEWREQLIVNIHQGIMASECISHKLGLEVVESHIRSLLVEYEARLGCLSPELDAEALIRRMKR